MKRIQNILLWLIPVWVILGGSGTGWAQYLITGGTALDKNPQFGSGGLNQGGAAPFMSYQSYLNSPSFQLTGAGLISNFSGFSPHLGPSAMQILTGQFNNNPPIISTGVRIGSSGQFGGASLFSVGPAMSLPSPTGGGLAVQQQLAPTLGNPLGPSPYMSLLQQRGVHLASPLEQNNAFGPPAPGQMMGPPAPGQPSNWNQTMGVPLGGASPRGLQTGLVSSLAAQFSRPRTIPNLMPGDQGAEENETQENEFISDPFATAKTQKTGQSTGARGSKSSWNPFDQTNTAEPKTDPWSFGGSKLKTAGNLGGQTVNPQLYASQSLVSSGGNNAPPPLPANQPPPRGGISNTSWLDSPSQPGKSAAADPWRSAVDAARGTSGLSDVTDRSADRRGMGREARPDRRTGGYGAAGADRGAGRTDPFASTLQPLDNLNTGGRQIAETPRSTAEADATVPIAVRDDIVGSQEKAERYLRQAKQALAAGQFYEAIGAFSLASVVLKLNPADEMLYLEALVAVGNFEQAGNILEKIVNQTGSIPNLTLENIKPAARMTMVRFLQTQEATANRLDRRFWVGVLTINQKEQISIFRKLQIELLMTTATQPNTAGVFSPKMAKAVLEYLSRQLEQH